MIEIPEYQGYFADENGDIWSAPKTTHKGFRKMTPHRSDRPYNHVTLTKGKKQNSVKVHYLVAQAYHGRRPEGLVIDHIDADTFNNRPNNLRYVTTKENIRRCQHQQDLKEAGLEWGVIRDGSGFKAIGRYEGKSYYLGLYRTVSEANQAVRRFKKPEDVSKIYTPRKLSSSTKGVCIHRSSGKWRANLGKKHLGWFETEEGAINARMEALRNA